MMSKAQQENTVKKVEQAVRESTNIIQGNIPNLEWIFYQPTVLDNIRSDMEIVTKEAFSPVLPILNASIQMLLYSQMIQFTD